ncbi:lipopolysaccharide assembly protein LapA domain-containing protein [Psychromonas sp. MME2]|uniref:LapA family protein n=1 Tax=unclassified Psychromonas TaxID=2614957 RepID=UPI00339B9EB3
MKRFLTLLVAVLFFIIAVVLGLKNQDMVNVNYIVAQSDMHLSTLLAITFTVGFAIAAISMGWLYLQLKVKNRLLRRANNKQRKELDKLLSQPVTNKD